MIKASSVIAIVLLAATSPALACFGHMPPKQQPPSVPYDVFYVAPSEIGHYCKAEAVGCTYPSPKRPARWIVIVDNTLSLDEASCTVTYEMAHMPPNYWGDPKVETPATMAWLAELKRTGAKR